MNLLNENFRSNIGVIAIMAGLMWTSHPIAAQGEMLFSNTRHKIGFLSGFGDQRWLPVSYEHEVVFFQFQYYYAIHRRRNWGLDLLIQPQYNTVRYKHVDGYNAFTSGYELGMNVGLLIRKNLWKDRLSFYFLFSIGPHYVSGAPERQEEGFIFSDNVCIGINVKLVQSLYFDLRPGIRHMSNAGLKSPSEGINNVFLSAGFMMLL